MNQPCLISCQLSSRSCCRAQRRSHTHVLCPKWHYVGYVGYVVFHVFLVGLIEVVFQAPLANLQQPTAFWTALRLLLEKLVTLK